jgi:hypothetical protein
VVEGRHTGLKSAGDHHDHFQDPSIQKSQHVLADCVTFGFPVERVKAGRELLHDGKAEEVAWNELATHHTLARQLFFGT